jgi:hypothetical protein
MGWFKQMSGSDATAGVGGPADTGINDSSYGTSEAILSALETSTPDAPGSLRADETKRRQLALLERYVAKVRRR